MAGSSEERGIAVVGSAEAPSWLRAWVAAERGRTPTAGPAAGPPRALWFLALWHLLMVSTWVWRGAESGAEDEEEGDRRAASAVARGAACGAELGAEAAPGAGGGWGDMSRDKEDGSGSVLDEAVAPDGASKGEVQ